MPIDYSTEFITIQKDMTTRGLQEREFSQPYVGEDIPTQLQSYIDQCWDRYCVIYSSVSPSGTLPYPYTTIVQRSGFGKSRLLRELAQRTKSSELLHLKCYTCAFDPMPRQTTQKRPLPGQTTCSHPWASVDWTVSLSVV